MKIEVYLFIYSDIGAKEVSEVREKICFVDEDLGIGTLGTPGNMPM